MGTQERRQREREEVREKIMDGARRLFAENGYDAVTVRKIAEQIEYSPTAVYVHFKDKRDLFEAICQTDFGALARQFQTIAQIQDPVERLQATGREYGRFALTYPNHYRLMFMTPHPPAAPCADEAAPLPAGPEENAYVFLRQTVSAVIEAGVLRPELQDVDLLAQTLWAGIHGVVSLRIAKLHDPWIEWPEADRSLETMMEALFRGLLRRDGVADGSKGPPRKSARTASKGGGSRARRART